jgi:hypothetical protein
MFTLAIDEDDLHDNVVFVSEFNGVSSGIRILACSLQNSNEINHLFVDCAHWDEESYERIFGIKGNTSVTKFELANVGDITPGTRREIEEFVQSSKNISQIHVDTLDSDASDETTHLLVNILRGSQTLEGLHKSGGILDISGGVRAVMEALKVNTTLKGLYVRGKICRDEVPLFASMLRVNTSLERLEVHQLGEFSEKNLVELESVLKTENQSLLELFIATYPSSTCFLPYLHRNKFLKLAKTLEKAPAAVLGAAITRLATDENGSFASSAIYSLLRKNAPAVFPSSQQILPARRPLSDRFHE